jgi:hypothetical protein
MRILKRPVPRPAIAAIHDHSDTGLPKVITLFLTRQIPTAARE